MYIIDRRKNIRLIVVEYDEVGLIIYKVQIKVFGFG